MGAKFQILVAGLFILLTLQAKAEADSHLINGTVVPTGSFTEVVHLVVNGADCTATVVGPRTIVTAAHCATTGATGTFTIAGHQYSAIMTKSPLYPAKDHDIGLGLTSEDITGVQPASIGGTASVGLGITLFGYGCTTAGGGTSDGLLRMGDTSITSFQDYDMISTKAGGAALCFGDSGGPAMLINNGVHQVLGVNSKGNIQDTNYDTRTDIADSTSFFNTFISTNSATICGVNSTCSSQPNDPATCTLTASPATLTLGQTTTLSLSSQNATSATINGQNIAVPSGQLAVTPNAVGTQTYQATVLGAAGNGTCSVAVTVSNPQTAAPTCTLTATPDLAKVGDTVTLQLTARGSATSGTIDGNTVTVPTGSTTITASAVGTFTSNGVVTGAGGNGSCAVTYTVSNNPIPPNTPNLAVVSTYCGLNTLPTDVNQVCLAVIKQDATLVGLQIANAVVITYRDLTQEVMPIIDRVTEPTSVGNLTVTEDLTLYANGTVSSNSVTLLDTRTATLVSLPPTHSGSLIPTTISGRSIKGMAFSVSTMSTAGARRLLASKH